VTAARLRRSLRALDRLQRRAALWTAGAFTGVVAGWLLLPLYFILGAADIGTKIALGYFLVVIVVCNKAYFGKLTGLPPLRRPRIAVTRRTYRLGVVAFAAAAAVTFAAIAWALWAVHGDQERQSVVGGRVGMTALALIAGLVYGGAAARRLWVPVDRALVNAAATMARERRL
jgi:hypothetical protein